MLALLLTVVLQAEPPACTARDAAGQRFAVCFDPWAGLELGAGGGLSQQGSLPVFSAGLRYRGRRDSRSKEASTWLVQQHFLAVELMPVDGKTAMTFSVWDGFFRRHAREGALTIPTTPPFLLPFPFDVALAGSVGRWQRRLAEGLDWSMELGRVALLLDVARSESGRFHLAVGPTAAYRLRSEAGALRHDVTPLTAGRVLFNFEGEDGLWVLRGQGVLGYTIDPLAPAQPVLRGRGEVQLERVLVAINDEPVALFVRGSGAWQDAGARAQTEWQGVAGLLVRFWSDR